MVNRLCDYKAQHAEMKRELGYSVFCFVLLCFAVGEEIIYMDGGKKDRE